MQEIRENIKLALACTIIPIPLMYLLYRHNLYTVGDIQMYILHSIAILSIIWKNFGNFLYHTLSKIGQFLGKYLAITALFFVYIFAVLPTGILMKIVKRDRLRLKKPDLSTYWVKYDNQNNDYEYQF